MREGWVELPFKEIASSLKRGPFGGNLKKAFFVEKGYKVYEQQHAINKSNQLGNYYISKKKYDELIGFAVGAGDYIISCSGTIGKIYRLPSNSLDGVINQALLKVTLKEGLLLHPFFSFLFQSSVFQRKILKDVRGTGMQNLAGMKEFREVPVPIPPLPEQRAIVAKIEELFSELDNGISNLQKAKEQLSIYRQAVLKKAFEGELTKEWRKMKNMDSDWGEDSLNNIGLWKGGGTPSKSRKEFWENGTVLWVSPKDMKTDLISSTIDKISEESIDHSSAKWIEKGSILIVVRSGIIRRMLPIAIASIRLTVNQDLQTIKPNEKVTSEYLFWYLKSNDHDIRNKCAKDGTTVDNVNVPSLKKYPIPVPSIKEQTQIVQEIESRLSVCDNALANIEEGLTKSEALRQSILKQAFEGKLLSEEELTACRQEPDWEPAEKLINRMKNETVHS